MIKFAIKTNSENDGKNKESFSKRPNDIYSLDLQLYKYKYVAYSWIRTLWCCIEASGTVSVKDININN